MAGTIWRASLALVLVALVTPLQLVGILLAPTVALLIGAAAGYSQPARRKRHHITPQMAPIQASAAG